MEATAENRAHLRLLLDEEIPPAGSDSDTRFSDAEIDSLLSAATYIEEAAAEGWERKADRAMSERGGLEEASGGSERMRFVRLQEYRDHCRQTAERFRRKVPGIGGSQALGLWPPAVLSEQDTDGDGYVDLTG